MATENPKLEAAKKRLEQAKAQLAQIEAKEAAKRRKEDTRVKVIVGAGIIADTEKNPETRAGVVAVLERAIVNPKDREFLKSKGWL